MQFRHLMMVVWLVAVICLIGGISFYFIPGMPRQPVPSVGHVHPINNHGYITFLNDREWIERGVLLGSGFVFITVFMVLAARHAQHKG